MRRILVPLALLAAPIITGAVGAVASANAKEFYAALDKPSWAPPPWLFGPVWSALYLMMGVAAVLVWRARSEDRGTRHALILFLSHLVINGLWSWLFFHWRLAAGSIADITLLWLMVAALTFWFFRLRPISGWLLTPYLAWVTFATALNVAIVQRNPDLLR